MTATAPIQPTPAVLDMLGRIEPLLPAAAPGTTVRALYAAIGAQWSPCTVRSALSILEREGIACSVMAPGGRNQPTRYFWRATTEPAGSP